MYGEGGNHGSNKVASMMYYFLTHTQPVIGNKTELHFHSDSCSGQNKNNIVLGYYMVMVAMGFYDVSDWYFMCVGHTKFLPNEIFGHIRQNVGERESVQSMD